MNADYFLKIKCEENQVEGVLKTEELYKNISDFHLEQFFAVMHQKINDLLGFMQSKKNINGHYNADESRELMKMIELYEEMKCGLKSTPLEFKLEEKYVNILKFCDGFLQESGG